MNSRTFVNMVLLIAVLLLGGVALYIYSVVNSVESEEVNLIPNSFETCFTTKYYSPHISSEERCIAEVPLSDISEENCELIDGEVRAGSIRNPSQAYADDKCILRFNNDNGTEFMFPQTVEECWTHPLRSTPSEYKCTVRVDIGHKDFQTCVDMDGTAERRENEHTGIEILSCVLEFENE